MGKKAVLLVNLGSPDSTSVPDVRRYLREFLMDERVIDLKPLARWFVVNCLILPTRPANTAEAYRKIWTDEGSPLVTMSERVRELEHRFRSLGIDFIHVDAAGDVVDPLVRFFRMRERRSRR